MKGSMKIASCRAPSCVYYFLRFFIGVKSLYKVVLISTEQQSESATCTHISPLLWISFPFRSPQSTEWKSLCYTVGRDISLSFDTPCMNQSYYFFAIVMKLLLRVSWEVMPMGSWFIFCLFIYQKCSFILEQCSCLENSKDGGAWWAVIHGVAKSWT